MPLNNKSVFYGAFLLGENSLTAVYYDLYGIAVAAYYYLFPAEPLWLDVGSEWHLCNRHTGI